MKRYLPIVSIFLLLTAGALLSQAILQARMLELEIALQREQVLKYELSSRMLRIKFREMLSGRSGIETEVRMTVLESSIMNHMEAESRRSHEFEEIGLMVINTVRAMTAKPPMDLGGEREKTALMHIAFFHERGKRCSDALAKYSELRKLLRHGRSPDDAFAALHSGYCRAISGDYSAAEEDLAEVARHYPGTHFASSAAALTEILQDVKQKAAQAAAATDSRAQAQQYYAIGNYRDAESALNRISDKSERERLMLARTQEEQGRMQEAAKGYEGLVAGAQDAELAREANRRLLLIGKFYGGTETMARKAEQTAIQMGDGRLVSTVREAAQMRQESQILSAQNNESEEIKTMLQEFRSKTVPILASGTAKPAQVFEPEIQLQLTDGRKLKGTSIRAEGDKLFLVGWLDLAIPAYLTDSIGVSTSPAGGEHLFELSVYSTAGVRQTATLRMEGGRLVTAAQEEIGAESLRAIEIGKAGEAALPLPAR